MKAFIIGLWTFLALGFTTGLLVPSVASSVLMCIVVMYFAIFRL